MRVRFVWLLLLAAGLPLPVAAQEPATAPTVVLVHGAWGGGWDWRTVEDELRAQGADVYRVTLTGLGARHHLASPDVGLDTHVADVVNVILWERLEDVILVGHSYGGMVITGVAEAVPQRLAHVVYVDAFVPFDGECVMSVGGRGECGSVEGVEGQVDGLLAPRWVEPGTPPPSDVPHPVRTFVDPLHLEGLPAHGRPASYILTRDAEGEPDGFDWAADRARELGWPVTEVIAGHNLQRDDPAWLADFIAGLG
jgi:pimeloyl-ACP methyl ester carboxylesterase